MSKLLKSFSIYTFVGFFSAGVGVFIMPILTHYLTPSDYGVLSLINTYVLILIPIIGFVSSGLISVEYFNKFNTNQDFSSIFSSITFIPVLPFIFFLSISIFYKDELASLISIQANYIFLIPILAFFTIYAQQFFSFLVTAKNTLLYAVANIGKVVVEVCLTLLFVIVIGLGWQGRIISWLIAMLILFIVFIVYFICKRLLVFNIRRSYIKDGLMFGTPLILHTLGKIVVNQSDRIFIVKMISMEELGIYNTGYMVGSVLLILSSAFINVYSPYLYERLSDISENKKIEIVRISYFFVIALSVALVILVQLTPFLYYYFIDLKYAKGSGYVFWIGLSYLFWGGYLMFAGFLFFKKKGKILGVLAIVNVVLNLAFNYVFIYMYGVIGAAYATALSFFIILVLVIVLSNKEYPMPWFRFKQLLNGID